MKSKFNSFGIETSNQRKRLVYGLTAVLTMTLALSACAKDDIISHLDSDLPKPVEQFLGTDAEVLAKAQEVFLRYLKLSDQILHDGGKNPERIGEVTTGDLYQLELDGFQEFLSGNYDFQGKTSAYNFSLQSVRYISTDNAVVTFYACLDLTESKLSDGNSEEASSSEQLLETENIISVKKISGKMDWKLEGSIPWEGTSFC